MLTIKGYDRGIGEAAFWGWDMTGAIETDLLYTFWVTHREMLWQCRIVLHRERVNDLYFCRVEDTNGKWSKGWGFPSHSLGRDYFWEWIEGVVNEEKFGG